MSNIRNIEDLRSEISRLKVISKQQEEVLRKDVKQVKEDLKPVNLVSGAFSSLTGIKFDKNSLLKDGLMVGASLLIQRFVFKTERKIETKLIDLAMQLIEKIKQTVHSFTKKNDEDNTNVNSGL